jgi:cytochrome c oxidase assembly protein subunit 11
MDKESTQKDGQQKNGKLAFKLSLFAVAMVCFVFFVLVPFYDVFCRAIGLGDRTASYATGVQENPSTPVVQQADETRTVKVLFLASNNADIGWDFHAMTGEMKIHPGATNEVRYYAKNTSAVDMVGQAVHSVSPPSAEMYFHKVECFCFKQQPLKAGESKEMPLKFVIDKDLPKDIQTVTISYTMFNAHPDKNSPAK